MGCASSQPAAADTAAGTMAVGKPAASPQPVAAVNGSTPQPLFAGPTQPSASPQTALPAAAAAVAAPAVTPQADQPVASTKVQAPSSTPAPVAVPTVPASPEAATTSRSRRTSAVSKVAGQPEEEDDWDQCSTNVELGAENEALAQQEPEASNSMMENAQSTFLGQADEWTADYAAPYRETATLRIDKVKGCMFVNQYLVVKYLGRGASGKVFLCLNTHDLRLYAMKAVRKVDLEASQQQSQNGKPRRNPMEDLKREIQIMKQMKHDNIVLLNEVIDDPSGSKLLLVMEYMEGGPVLTRESLERREKLPESLALAYFRDMVKALDYLHSRKVVHGDLKPENVLMAANGEVKLSDFGCSKVFATGNEYLERCNGTPAFLAPEMMKPNTRYRGRPTDVYALGACLYTLVFGRIPFSAPNLYKLFQVVQNDPVKYPDDTLVSDALRNLLDAMLIKNPRQRIPLQDVMKHPWVTMYGQFPLKCTEDLVGDETQEAHNQLPEGMTYAEAHPPLDYLTGLAMSYGYERSFMEGDVLMRQGDTGGHLLYIVSGTVDVLVKWMQPPANTSRTLYNAQASGHSGQLPTSSDKNATQDGFMDDSDSLSPIVDQEGYTHRANLVRAAAKACEFVTSLLNAGGEGNNLLVAQRGAGDLVGDMALFSRSLTRCATVRCVTPVTARILTHQQLVDYLVMQPLAKHQIREGIWKKECEITMVEALVKLANVHGAVNQTLQSVHSSLVPVSNSSLAAP